MWEAGKVGSLAIFPLFPLTNQPLALGYGILQGDHEIDVELVCRS